MLAGAAGYTYGCNDIWQMYETGRDPVINARTGWKAAMDLPGSKHMKYMKEFFELLPWQDMIPDQSPVLNDNPENESYIICASDTGKKFIIAYTPQGKSIKINLSAIDSKIIDAYWFNPRSGEFKFIGEYSNSTVPEFKPWATGRGSDFLLLLKAKNNSINPDPLIGQNIQPVPIKSR